MKSWEAAASQSDSTSLTADADPLTTGLAVTIIGSRDVTRETARQLFEQHLVSLLHQRRTWLVGGARGIDQWALEWLREHNETCWAVIPYTMREQPPWVEAWLEQ